MEAILKVCTQLKLSDGKHAKAFFNHMAAEHAHDEAAFLLAANDYIFNPDDQKAAVFPAVFWNKQSYFRLNLSDNLRGKVFRMIGAQEVQAKMAGTNKVVTFDKNQMVKNSGVRQGGAANYNLITKAIDTCYRDMIRENINRVVASVESGTRLGKGTTDKSALNDIQQYMGSFYTGNVGQTLKVA